MSLRIVVGFILLAGCGAASSGSATREPLSPGVDAPDFMAQDQDGRVRQLSLLARRRPVVLFFYPRDGTPGCTREACAFRDAWDRLQSTGALVVGVSTDPVSRHAQFARELDLPFPLLSDPDGRILRLYGVSSAMGVSARVTFVIDPNGRVAHTFPAVDPALHVDEVLAVLERLPDSGQSQIAQAGGAATTNARINAR